MTSHAAQPREHVELDLSWYVNGTLPANERSRIERHLAECERCRKSHAFEVRLAAQLRDAREPVECAPQSGWNRLAVRLDALESDVQTATAAAPSGAATSTTTARARPPRAARRRILPLVLVAQAAALAMLAFTLLYVTLDDSAPRYRTLTRTDGSAAAASTAGPVLRIVFDESASNAEIRSLLERVGGSIVAGPTDRRVYTVRLQRTENGTPADPDAAADWLRTQPRVLFVEPVETAWSP